MAWKQITRFFYVLIDLPSEIPEASSSLLLPSFSYNLVSLFQADPWCLNSSYSLSLRLSQMTGFYHNLKEQITCNLLNLPNTFKNQVGKAEIPQPLSNPDFPSQRSKTKNFSSTFCLFKIKILIKYNLSFCFTWILHSNVPSNPKSCLKSMRHFQCGKTLK